MDIRTRKTMFLESLYSTEVIHKAVSLAIDCIIENHINDDNTPLVITSYDDFCRHQVLNSVQQFCEAAYPRTDRFYFNPNMLHINGCGMKIKFHPEPSKILPVLAVLCSIDNLKYHPKKGLTPPFHRHR